MTAEIGKILEDFCRGEMPVSDGEEVRNKVTVLNNAAALSEEMGSPREEIEEFVQDGLRLLRSKFSILPDILQKSESRLRMMKYAGNVMNETSEELQRKLEEKFGES